MSADSPDFPPAPKSGAHPPRWAAAWILLFTALVFAPTLGYPFLQVGFDDPGFVAENPAVGPLSWQRLWLCISSLTLYDYVPLPMLSYLLEYQLWGTWAGGYHLGNVALHLGNALLVQRWAAAVSGQPLVGWLAGLMFAVHPLQVETVAVIAQRKTILSTTFLLLSLMAFDRWRRSPRERVSYFASLFAFAAACLSKSSVVPFPLLLLWYERWFFGAVQSYRDKVPFLILAAATAGLSVLAKWGEVVKPAHADFLTTALLMARVWWEYLASFVFPADLSPAYYYRRQDLHSFGHWVALAAIGPLIAALWYRGHRWPAFTFWLGWTALSLLPVSNLVPIAVVRADRYLYLPMVAFAWFAACAISRLAAATAGRSIALNPRVLGLLFASLFAARSAAYLPTFRDDVSARAHAVARHPWAAAAHYLLAVAYAEQGQPSGARHAAERALELDPTLQRAAELLARLPQEEEGAATRPSGTQAARSQRASPVPVEWLLACFILGSVVGSFLNVCIARLPRGESIVHPPSHCPRCGSRIQPWDNIPILSFLWLRGRCRACGEPISWQYPLVEALTGVLFAANFWAFGASAWTAVACVFCAALVVVSFIDLEHQIIPDVVSLPGIAVGLLFALLGWGPPLLDRAVGTVLGGGILWGVAEFYERVRAREGMGGGDIKLLAMIGAFLGWKAVLTTLLFASLSGSLAGGLRLLADPSTGSKPIPFGPFLALGAVLSLYFADSWIAWYLNWAAG